MGKITETRELYRNTVNEITQSEEKWQTFLDSAAWQFKYDFDDQVLIYAQNPNARACAEAEEWYSKLKRWVNLGANNIFVFSKSETAPYPFRIVFDVSDTSNENKTELKLWKAKPEYEQEIINSLEINFGEIANKETLGQAISFASYNMVSDKIMDYMTSIQDHKTGTLLEDATDGDIELAVTTTVWASVSYMIMTRCGLNPKEYITPADFSFISKFNRYEITTALGMAISDIAEIGLREIARTITNVEKNEKEQNRTFDENISKEYYNNKEKENEGGIDYGRNGETNLTNREIRKKEIKLSKRTQKARIHYISNGRQISGTSKRDTGDRQSERGTDNRGHEEKREYNGRIESNRPNEMGSNDEQPQNGSRRDSNGRTNLQLNIYKKEDGANRPYVVVDEKINQILSITPYLKQYSHEIISYFTKEQDIQKRADLLKGIINNEDTNILVDDEIYGYKPFDNGVLFWKGNFLSRDRESFFEWNKLTYHYDSMIMLKQLENTEGLPEFLEEQKNEEPSFEFTQEFIDRYLQEESKNLKFEIYRQFEKSLSSKENIEFLKKIYGMGGATHTVKGSGVGETHDSKGIKFNRGYFDKSAKEQLFKWNYIEKRIKELIKIDRYLSEKEKRDYPKWLEQKEQEKQLREAEKRLNSIQTETADDKLAKRVYNFVTTFDLYSYIDNSKLYNTEQENIDAIKADIGDRINVKDYVKAMDEIIGKMAQDNEQLGEAKEVLEELKRKVPKYEYHLGDKVYIGIDEYEILSIDEDVVKLYDSKFPILNREMGREEFDRKVQENYANDHLIVEETEQTQITEENKSSVEQNDSNDKTNIKEFLEEILKKCDFESDSEIKVNSDNKLLFVNIGAYKYEPQEFYSYIIDHIDDGDYGITELEKKRLLDELAKVRKEQKEYLIGKEVEYDNAIYTVIDIQESEAEEDYAVIQNKENKKTTVEPVGFVKYLLEDSKEKSKNENQEERIKKLKSALISIHSIGYNNTLNGREFSWLTYEDSYESLCKEYKELTGKEFNINEFIVREEEKVNETNESNNTLEEKIEPKFEKTSNKIQNFDLHPDIKDNNRLNFKITNDNLGIGTPRQKFARNIEAIRTLKKCEAEDRYATAEEQEILSEYIGWGGLPQVFDEKDSNWSAEYLELKELLNEEEYKQARSSTLTAFYTPPVVIRSMYKALENMGLKEANILEPSCGTGNFLGMLPNELEKCKMYGVELDSITARIAQQLYQKSTIAPQGYEKVDMPDSFFDIAIRKCTISETLRLWIEDMISINS